MECSVGGLSEQMLLTTKLGHFCYQKVQTTTSQQSAALIAVITMLILHSTHPKDWFHFNAFNSIRLASPQSNTFRPIECTRLRFLSDKSGNLPFTKLKALNITTCSHTGKPSAVYSVCEAKILMLLGSSSFLREYLLSL